MSRLRATYRLQLHAGVGLPEAAALAPQLEQLGVSHLYLSPILRARAGSTHGYDGVDPTQIDPALGGEVGMERLARRLRARGLGVLLDIVPNHLALAPGANPFVDDVLAHGPASRFARWFDVDWGPPRPDGHAPWLLPFLERPLPEALARGEFALEWSGRGFCVRHVSGPLPLDPATAAPLLERVGARLRRGVADARALAAIARALRALPPRHARGATARSARAVRLATELEAHLAARPALRNALGAEMRETSRGAPLARLLARQAWRLEDWRRARRRLNYRRFFDVNDLVAVRQEDPAVFAATHAKVLDLVERGLVHGLRVDHVDGLLDPRGYLRRLRAEVDARLPARRRRDFPVVVEKILEQGETLPAGWPVAGTTGYEFLNELEATLLDPEGARRIEANWARVTGRRRPFEATACRSKRRALEELLASDLERATDAAGPRDAAERSQLRRALRELVVHLGVYRTYAGPGGRLRAEDARRLREALDAARRERLASTASLARIAGRLGLTRGGRASAELLGRLQQLSGPAAAKGVEDTALYVHTPLLSRNEVGGDPGSRLGDALASFHRACRERARRWPGTLLAASTHDTKRSADVRARLDVLSEIPARWAACLEAWCASNRPLRVRSEPDRSTELFVYQTLVGLWPASAARARPPSGRALLALRERVGAYLLKAAREAKVRTSWTAPDPGFERALETFVAALLGEPGRANGFQADLTALVAEVARPGLWNSLARTAVQLAAPGVPDVYQGDELFELALVDPDNRRPVDFEARRRALRQVSRAFARQRVAFVREIVSRPEDGRIKLHALRTGLQARRAVPGPFAEGDYRPLEASGAAASHVLAFARAAARDHLVLAVPRLPRTLVGDPQRAPTGSLWGDARLLLPPWLAGRSLVSVFTGERLRVSRSSPELPLARLLADFPAALLLTRSPQRGGDSRGRGTGRKARAR